MSRLLWWERTREGFSLRLPWRRLLYAGRDRHGARFVALARYEVLGGFIVLFGSRELRVTWGGWRCWQWPNRDGAALGRLWLEW